MNINDLIFDIINEHLDSIALKEKENEMEPSRFEHLVEKRMRWRDKQRSSVMSLEDLKSLINETLGR